MQEIKMPIDGLIGAKYPSTLHMNQMLYKSNAANIRCRQVALGCRHQTKLQQQTTNTQKNTRKDLNINLIHLLVFIHVTMYT